MADRVVPGPVEDQACIREAVCINTRKIFDSCRDKDCVDDLRVYPTLSSQSNELIVVELTLPLMQYSPYQRPFVQPTHHHKQ